MKIEDSDKAKEYAVHWKTQKEIKLEFAVNKRTQPCEMSSRKGIVQKCFGLRS